MPKPLILLTRERGKNHELATLLASRGFAVDVRPLTHTLGPRLPARWMKAVAAADGCDWLAFTSARAVEAYVSARRRLRMPCWPPARVAAVGLATARAVEAADGAVDYRPAAASAAGLVAAWPEPPKGLRILVPRAERGRPELVVGLRRRRATVIEAVAYRTLASPIPVGSLRQIARRRYAAIVLQAPSAVVALARAARAAGIDLRGRLRIAVAGSTTADAARKLEPEVLAIAAEPTAAGLVVAIRAAAAEAE